ncbi:primase-helicase family protein, partial [Belliella pelovolcani]|uniref:primase-helicase family protein n=1 Tax=Belliella pelovolcani TaxID=529505 RepID=UPI00391A8BD9
EDADRYMRIGIDWVKIIKVPNKYGLLETKVKRWSVAEIKRDYPKYVADLLINSQIPKYDSYHLEPCWDPARYQRTVHGCYNLMEPLIHDIKPGRIDSTLEFIKHIFGGKGSITWNEKENIYEEEAFQGDQFTVAMDYLSIQLQYPKKALPVPCLVSPENGTGKSTFLKWLCLVFNGNGVILNNDRFKMNFNGHYASKYIIGLDEGFLEVDKKAEKEKLKQLVTSDTIFLENKGMDIQEIPYYGKLIICSNDADNLMKMEDEETRWFVVKVPKLKKKDPFLFDKMKEEIPAWLYFIANRKIFHKEVDRLWFDPKDFITDQMQRIIEVTKNQVDASVETWVKNIFLTYKVDELKIGRTTMLRYINENKKYRIDEEKLKYYLENKCKMPYTKTARCKIPIQIIDIGPGNVPNIQFHNEVSRHYHFKPEEWLTEKEMKEYHSPWSFEPIEESDDQPKPSTFKEAEKLDDKQYKQEELWDKRKGPAPF